MTRGKWRSLGDAEEIIVKYLALNPAENIQAIQLKTGTPNYATVNNAVHNLKAKEVLRELDAYKSEKGNQVSLWGLSYLGVFIALELNVDVKQTLSLYEQYYPDLKWLNLCFKILEEELGDKWLDNRAQLLRDISAVGGKLVELGIVDQGILINTISGYVSGFFAKNHVSPAKMKRFSHRMMIELKVNNVAELRGLLNQK